MLTANRDHAFGVVMLFDSPRRVKVVPLKVRIATIWYGRSKLHFAP